MYLNKEYPSGALLHVNVTLTRTQIEDQSNNVKSIVYLKCSLYRKTAWFLFSLTHTINQEESVNESSL